MNQRMQEMTLDRPPAPGAYVVALPLTDQEHTLRLLPLAQAIAHHHGGRVLIVPYCGSAEDEPLSSGMLETTACAPRSTTSWAVRGKLAFWKNQASLSPSPTHRREYAHHRSRTARRSVAAGLAR
ncbi:MAG: hypothetical protein U0074_05550 [Kouleothrix sp.]